MSGSDKLADEYPDDEAQRRFEAALQGAFNTPLPPKIVNLKKENVRQKSKLVKASPSSDQGRILNR